MIEALLMGGAMGLEIKHVKTGFVDWASGISGVRSVTIPVGANRENVMVVYDPVLPVADFNKIGSAPFFDTINLSGEVIFNRNSISTPGWALLKYSIIVLNRQVTHIKPSPTSYPYLIPELSGLDPEKTLIYQKYSGDTSSVNYAFGERAPYGYWDGGDFYLDVDTTTAGDYSLQIVEI